MQESSPLISAYESALPDDPAVKRKQMFGSPCAFVNRQMFFGTFENSLIARVGPSRVRGLISQPGMQVFTPSPGKEWSDYVQMEPTLAPDVFSSLATEAMAWTLALPKKMKRSKK